MLGVPGAGPRGCLQVLVPARAGGGQEALPDRGHLVADGDGVHHDHCPARGVPPGARLRHAALLWGRPCPAGREGPGAAGVQPRSCALRSVRCHAALLPKCPANSPAPVLTRWLCMVSHRTDPSFSACLLLPSAAWSVVAAVRPADCVRRGQRRVSCASSRPGRPCAARCSTPRRGSRRPTSPASRQARLAAVPAAGAGPAPGPPCRARQQLLRHACALQGHYFTGDGAKRHRNGYITITGGPLGPVARLTGLLLRPCLSDWAGAAQDVWTTSSTLAGTGWAPPRWSLPWPAMAPAWRRLSWGALPRLCSTLAGAGGMHWSVQAVHQTCSASEMHPGACLRAQRCSRGERGVPQDRP